MPQITRFTPLAVAIALIGHALAAQAQTEQLPKVEVITVSPLPGLGIPKDQVPGNVQTATAADLDRRQALDLSDFLGRSLGSVNLNAMQNNPFQPDLNYRGFTASPLLGTPQGLSVFLDGVRMNQPFGDVVSWDLIPKSAIASVALMPGSNPLFGLNTLGGALSVRTKDGLSDPGTSLQILGGSNSRVAAEFESGGASADRSFHWFITGNRFHEKGWRVASPSDMTQLFAKLGARMGSADVTLSLAAASNDLTGNGTQEQGALERDYKSVFTIPDNTRNKSQLVNLQLSQPFGAGLTFTANAYYRRIRTNTFNGDLNDDAAGESIYQPNAGERTALTNAGYTGFPTSGESAANTPFPKWRCIAQILLNSEPNEKCNGLINRTATTQSNYGFAAQVSAKADAHLLLAGVAHDANRVQFNQSAQFGYLLPDRSIATVDGPGAFADGSQDTENLFDARVDLASRSHTTSVFASDTIELNPQTHLTVAGRYNRNTVRNRDAITPGGGSGSLDGDHSFSHFNPAIGLTFAASAGLTVYGGINQGSRAPSAIELGCADPDSPCKLPNSFAGDPPLKQVVTTTVEAGLRGSMGGGLAWNVGVYRSDNKDDLLFVADNAAGFGYFKNFGKTRRQGLELGISGKAGKALTLGANFSLLQATYRSPETVDGSSNSSNEEAEDGFPGQEGTIDIRPGDRIPNLPQRQLKLYADWAPSAQWHVGLDMAAMSGANARGNENGQYQADGTYYTGSGRSPGYAVFNLDADYQPTSRLKLFAQITNLFDRKYSTGAQLGGNPFNAAGNYVARPIPRPAGADEFPAISGTFLAPGAPRAFSVGLRFSFD